MEIAKDLAEENLITSNGRPFDLYCKKWKDYWKGF